MAWLILLLVSAGLVLLGAGTHGDVTRISDAEAEGLRAEITPINLPAPIVADGAAPVSHMLRRPVRVIDSDTRQHDLGILIGDALASFGHEVYDEDRLTYLLLMSLSEGWTDQHIDTVLNAALARGDFEAPQALITSQYRFDTRRLLDAVLALAAL